MSPFWQRQKVALTLDISSSNQADQVSCLQCHCLFGNTCAGDLPLGTSAFLLERWTCIEECSPNHRASTRTPRHDSSRRVFSVPHVTTTFLRYNAGISPGYETREGLSKGALVLLHRYVSDSLESAVVAVHFVKTYFLSQVSPTGNFLCPGWLMSNIYFTVTLKELIQAPCICNGDCLCLPTAAAWLPFTDNHHERQTLSSFKI